MYNSSLVEKSHQLNKIYDKKDQLEKLYGKEAVKFMSPVREINNQYGKLLEQTEKNAKDAVKEMQ